MQILNDALVAVAFGAGLAILLAVSIVAAEAFSRRHERKAARPRDRAAPGRAAEEPGARPPGNAGLRDPQHGRIPGGAARHGRAGRSGNGCRLAADAAPPGPVTARRPGRRASGSTLTFSVSRSTTRTWRLGSGRPAGLWPAR